MSSSHADHKYPVLDGLRAISILLVLGAHLLPLGPKVLELNETAGAMGMSLFFALSGFLITSTLIKNPDIRAFIVRRFARILPLAYAYVFVIFLLFSIDPKALLWTILFVVNYQTQYLTPWTGHLWSLCVEMQFYLAIALVVLVFGRKGLWIVWPACLVITLLRIDTATYIALETHLRVDEILSGACIATLPHNRFSGRGVPAALAIAAILWALSAWPFSASLQFFRPYTTALFLLAGIHYGAANPATLLASRPMRYIATISYALYVIHPATAAGWMNEGSTTTRYLLKRPVSLALTFLLAHLSTFYWENRWQSAAKRWIQKRQPAESPEIGVAPTATSR